MHAAPSRHLTMRRRRPTALLVGVIARGGGGGGNRRTVVIRLPSATRTEFGRAMRGYCANTSEPALRCRRVEPPMRWITLHQRRRDSDSVQRLNRAMALCLQIYNFLHLAGCLIESGLPVAGWSVVHKCLVASSRGSSSP